MRSPSFYFFSGVLVTIITICAAIAMLIAIAGGFSGSEYKITSSLKAPGAQHLAIAYYHSAGGAAGSCDVSVVVDTKDITNLVAKGKTTFEQEVFGGSCNMDPTIEWVAYDKLLIRYNGPKDLGEIRIRKKAVSEDGQVKISFLEM